MADASRPKPNRRRVLKWAGAVAGVGGLGALGYGGHVANQLRLRGYILRTPTGEARALPEHAVERPRGSPQLVIARGQNTARVVAAALLRVGGMRQFMHKGDTVVVKPNVGFKKGRYFGVTTDPDVVGAVVRACVEAGAGRVIVTDGPVNDIGASFHNSGIQKATLAAGGDVVTPADTHYVNGILAGWGAWPILEPYAIADKIITVPATKHHGLSGTTVGMKGWFGAIGGMRPRLHDRIDESIVALAQMFKPTLTVVDAVRVLMRRGPHGGTLDDVREEHAVAVSTDPVAADAWASLLVNDRVSARGWLAHAEERGLGVADHRKLGPIEITV